MYYSPSTGGFYHSEIHGDKMPSDVISIDREHYDQLLQGQSEGRRIVPDEHGNPMLQEPSIDHVAAIAARRYLVETGGITVDGMPLDTGRDSQALVTGAALAAVIDSAYRCQWKTASGFIDLDAQQIIALASAMRAHVQVCFNREAELLDALAAGTYTDEQLDQGWPA